MYTYDRDFFEYVSLTSGPSAREAVPVVRGLLGVGSVLDVGCGCGAWLREWQRNGVSRFAGVDGPYVDVSRLLIPRDRFRPLDLQSPFSLGERFDLVSCLEVGEHLPADRAASLVQCLCAHGDLVMFSAATPGQGGENHVNEQPYSYWKRLFEANGFTMFDCIRPALADRRVISAWYRYNTFLYVRGAHVGALPAPVRSTVVPPGAEPQDLAPAWYRWRRAAIGLLPVREVTRLSVIKKRSVYYWHRLRDRR